MEERRRGLHRLKLCRNRPLCHFWSLAHGQNRYSVTLAMITCDSRYMIYYKKVGI